MATQNREVLDADLSGALVVMSGTYYWRCTVTLSKAYPLPIVLVNTLESVALSRHCGLGRYTQKTKQVVGQFSRALN